MNKFEKAVAEHYRQEGWDVLSNGWPDFLCVRKGKNSKYELLAVEVKSKNDKLRPNQEQNLAFLSTRMPVLEVREGPGYGRNRWAETGDVTVLTYDMDRYNGR